MNNIIHIPPKLISSPTSSIRDLLPLHAQLFWVSWRQRLQMCASHSSQCHENLLPPTSFFRIYGKELLCHKNICGRTTRHTCDTAFGICHKTAQVPGGRVHSVVSMRQFENECLVGRLVQGHSITPGWCWCSHCREERRTGDTYQSLRTSGQQCSADIIIWHMREGGGEQAVILAQSSFFCAGKHQR